MAEHKRSLPAELLSSLHLDDLDDDIDTNTLIVGIVSIAGNFYTSGTSLLRLVGLRDHLQRRGFRFHSETIRDTPRHSVAR